MGKAVEREGSMTHGLRQVSTWPRHKSKAKKRHKLRKIITRSAQRERDAARSGL